MFFILYNLAISFTTAARASLALATLPLSTMLVAALFGFEKLTLRKTLGVVIAVLGVAAALAAGLSAAPSGAWRGELIMLAAVLCNAFYTVLSRPFMQRSSALGFLTVGMGAGAAMLIIVGLFTGSIAALKSLSGPQWLAGDRQPDCSGAFGNAARRRADHVESGRGPGGSLCGDLDRNLRDQEAVRQGCYRR